MKNVITIKYQRQNNLIQCSMPEYVHTYMHAHTCTYKQTHRQRHTHTYTKIHTE